MVRSFHSRTAAEQHRPRPDRHPLSTAGLDHWEPGASPHSWSERVMVASSWTCFIALFLSVGQVTQEVMFSGYMTLLITSKSVKSNKLHYSLYHYISFTQITTPVEPSSELSLDLILLTCCPNCVLLWNTISVVSLSVRLLISSAGVFFFFIYLFFSINVLLLRCRVRCFTTLHVAFFFVCLEALCRSCNRSRPSSSASSTEIDSMRHTFPPLHPPAFWLEADMTCHICTSL